MVSKDEIAQKLARVHMRIDPGIRTIVRVLAKDEAPHEEPVKLLEVNPETPAAGIMPISFGPEPPEIPFPSVVIEVTEEEFARIKKRTLKLPFGWKLGGRLYPSSNGTAG